MFTVAVTCDGAHGPPVDRSVSWSAPARFSAEPEYRGCPFLAALVELKDPEHPASAVASGAKQRLKEEFRAQAEFSGARDPELLARQLMLVFDGASARAGARVETLQGLATTTVTVLLDAADVT